MTISEKKSLEFEGEWEGAYERVLREEIEGRHVVIISRAFKTIYMLPTTKWVASFKTKQKQTKKSQGMK